MRLKLEGFSKKKSPNTLTIIPSGIELNYENQNVKVGTNGFCVTFRIENASNHR